ncbi:MAG: enoyl-CoA hydratase/isomerase family protein [Solirubrobacteraceae bacterium]
MEASNGHGLERSREGGLARLALAKPPRNLLDPGVMSALREAILEADADSDVQAVVLTGAGDTFCGGLDIERIQAGEDPVAFASALVALLRVLPTLGKPVIAAVNGDALASGYALVCAADIAVTVDSARIGTFEASVGIWPMVAQVPPLQRLHPRHALENLLTGEPFDAQRAWEIGIVNEVVGAGELWPAVERWAQRSVRAGAALAAGRRSFYRFRELSYDDALDASLEQFRGMFTATEHTIEAGERA